MSGTLLGVWLELSASSLFVTTYSMVVLWWGHGSDHLEKALGRARTREELLQETCFESDAGWARLVRDALLEELAPARAELDYRHAPARREPTGALRERSRRELARVRRWMALGLVGVAVSQALAIKMLLTPGFFWIGVPLLATVSWMATRIVFRGRRASGAVQRALSELPRLSVDLAAPPPLRLVGPSRTLARPKPTSRWFAMLLAIPIVIQGSLVVSMTFTALTWGKAIPVLATMGSLLPLLLIEFVLLKTARVELDVSRREIAVVHKLLGLTYARTVLPLEIVERFATTLPAGRAALENLVADIGGRQIDLDVDDDATDLAEELNRVLESGRRDPSALGPSS